LPQWRQPSGNDATADGEQCFQQATSAVSSGSVNMYYPNTTTPKTTWQNAQQTGANTQPIQLDANGSAIHLWCPLLSTADCRSI
jgi:hypothetical protein